MRQHVDLVLTSYICNENLKGADDNVKKVPLRDALQCVVTNIELVRRRRRAFDLS